MLSIPRNIICGYFDSSKFGNVKYSPKRNVTKFEIDIFLKDGSFTYSDDKTYEIKKDYIQIGKPGQIRYSLLPFSTAHIKFDVSDKIADMLNEAPEYFYSSHAKKILNVIDEIILLSESRDEEDLLLQSHLFSLLNLIILDSKCPTKVISVPYQTISNAKRFIEQHAHEKITLHDIADSVSLSDYYFHNNFVLATGITPHKYLIQCRIEMAKKLLWNKEISIITISERCGFSSQQHFNMVFKKETDMSPLNYRKELQNKFIEE